MVLLGVVALALAACATFRITPADAPDLIPPGRSLGALVEARRLPEVFLPLAESFGMDKDLARRVDQVVFFDTDSGGRLGLVTGDIPLGPTSLALGLGGWTRQDDIGGRQVFAKAGIHLLLLRDGALLLSAQGTPALAWYMGWQAKGAAPVDGIGPLTGLLGEAGLFAGMSTDMSTMSTTFDTLSVTFVTTGKSPRARLSLTFQDGVDERRARSAARLLFLQTFVALGLDPAALVEADLVWLDRTARVDGVPVSGESLATALASLVAGTHLR